ncbi:MAG: hypothetical protein IJE44_01815 [Clostridia bacterium]|nr:hypothetical protein [Clostridia bacterium]
MKKFKHLTALLLVFVLAFAFVSCGDDAVKEAEQTVHNMFSALKAFDLEALNKFVEDSEDITDTDNALLTENTEEVVKAMFGGVDYKIISSEQIDEDTVNVKTSITAIDMKPVFKDFFASAMQLAFTSAFSDMSEDELTAKMEEMLWEKITAPDLDKITTEVTLEVSKEDGIWKVDADDNFSDALMGGLEEAVEEIESSFGG